MASELKTKYNKLLGSIKNVAIEVDKENLSWYFVLFSCYNIYHIMIPSEIVRMSAARMPTRNERHNRSVVSRIIN